MGKRKRGLKGNKKRHKPKSIENTEAWVSAEWKFSTMIAQDMMPLLGAPLVGRERIKRLINILKICPEYYPASLDLGYRYIMEGKDRAGKESIDKGLQSLKTHFSKKDLADAYHHICEFLEKHLRFEMAIGYYNQLKELERDKAKVYDSLACCYANLGDLDKAFEIQQNAIELCGSNHRFYCNMGWVEMLRGNPDAAEIMLVKSLDLNPKDRCTLNNYEVCKRMRKSKRLKNWEAYLLRKIDWVQLGKLEDEDDMEEYEKQVRIYNRERIEAFKIDIMRNPNYTLSDKYDILFTLNYIFGFIWGLHSSAFFFYDDMHTIRDYFKQIMHRFIIKTGDVDKEIFDDVYTALLEFYKFLARRKVVSGYKRLENEMLSLKPELMKKMSRYNAVRHNDEYTEAEKEEIREELFEGDDFWPFL